MVTGRAARVNANYSCTLAPYTLPVQFLNFTTPGKTVGSHPRRCSSCERQALLTARHDADRSFAMQRAGGAGDVIGQIFFA